MAVTIIDGGGVEREVDVRNPKFFVRIDGQDLFPVHVDLLEIENSGETQTITVDCGDTERRKTANKGWIVSVEGLVSTNDTRGDNLSMQKLRDVIAHSEVINIRSALLSGKIVVSNVVITSADDAVEIVTERTHGREKVWGFRMTLGEEESDA